MTTATQDKDFAAQKLRNAIAMTNRLIAGDWPNKDSLSAVHSINSEFKKKLEGLLELDASDDVTFSWCKDSRQLVARYLSFVGLILRSSNIRNAFELYHPIRQVCEKLLGEEQKIIIGSEWSYTPFVYPIPVTSLERYIFVGLPASEAQNALLVPIAGHELGHAVWRRTKVGSGLITQIQEMVIDRVKSQSQPELFEGDAHKVNFQTDMKARQAWSKPTFIAVRQCEEVFCDLIGCWIFGESYIHAFRYLIFPDVGPRQSDHYPTNKSRAEFLAQGYSKYHGMRTSIAEFFTNPLESSSPEVRQADATTRSMVPFIIDKVDEYCTEKGLTRPSVDRANIIKDQLKSLKPALPGEAFCDIINAAWRVRFELDDWNVPGVSNDRKPDILNELVFKSLEVDEYATWERVQK